VRRCGLAVMAALVGLSVVSCNWVGLMGGCSGVGYYALALTIRDTRGAPQALDAQVTLYDGEYREQASTSTDSLSVYAGQDRGGRTYDILVSKRYYRDTWVRGVATRGGGCVTGQENPPVTRTVPIVLPLAPGAPPARSLRLLPARLLLDRSPYTTAGAFTPYLDADVGVSRAITWKLTGDTGSVRFDPATGALQYRCLARSGYLTVTAVSVADSSLVATASVAVQGHPAAVGDPPCS
jgi:hypothetical protein